MFTAESISPLTLYNGYRFVVIFCLQLGIRGFGSNWKSIVYEFSHILTPMVGDIDLSITLVKKFHQVRVKLVFVKSCIGSAWSVILSFLVENFP